MPLFLAGIMIFSVIGFSLGSSQSDTTKEKYNGHMFRQSNQGWITYINDQPIIISQNPNLLNPISLPGLSLDQLNSANKRYFTINPADNLQLSLAYFNQNFGPRLKSTVIACIEDSEPCKDLPLKTCEDATLTEKVIQINLANESSMTYQNNCLHIQGQKQEIINFVDSLILQLLLQ